MESGRLVRLVAAAVLAFAWVVGAEIATRAFSVCCVQCTCVNLCCGGSGCSCEAWEEAWFAYNGGGGCDWDCGGDDQGRSCCNEYCEEG
jgi:hypothetical protein